MKTLDEVIEELHFWDTCDEWPESFYDFEVTRDALHYLKMLQDVTCGTSQKLRNTSQITCPKCHSEFVILPDANDPLDWDELRQMEGKPVFMARPEWKEWLLVSEINEDTGEIYLRDKWGNGVSVNIRNFGYWRAYRKERL